MPIEEKYIVKSSSLFKDVRPWQERTADWFSQPDNALIVYGGLLGVLFLPLLVPAMPKFQALWDLDLIIGLVYLRWFKTRVFKLPFKMPKHAAPMPDPQNNSPSEKKKSNGVLYLGNDRKTQEEVWLTDSDARTHMLYLGTTGAGKTKGLQALATNSLCWASGFTFVDGKADTGNWGDLYALARRFGRDDDLLIINYMTGNSDEGSSSNSMNPFSSGSASYLVQMLVSLLAEGGGENAMWKERAISLVGALMPALTFKRDRQNQMLDIDVIRQNFNLDRIIALSRDSTLPQRILLGLKNYLDTLPGYVDEAFDDDGKEKPPSPDTPVFDLTTARQQHGYLSMQFTRSLQSLADDYSYIFKAQMADVDVLDVVLNRRILVVLIPALEKSADEAANLGKIVAAALKGMMGSALGAMVEGSWQMAIENKSTNSPASYMTIFDEVGYYTAQGMAVMAAQARSLGFSLVFAAQDLPAMEKRVKEEARSIAGNCNLKIFGKLEDPTGTREFFENTVGKDNVMQVQSKKAATGMFNPYTDDSTASIQSKSRASYGDLKEQREGEVVMLFSEHIVAARMPYIDAGKPKALRVAKLLPVPATTQLTKNREDVTSSIATKLADSNWSASRSSDKSDGTLPPLLAAAIENYRGAGKQSGLEAGLVAIANLPDPAKLAADAAMPQGKMQAGKAQPRPGATRDANRAELRAEPTTTRKAVPRAQNGMQAATPSEQDIARVQVKVDSPLPPFALPKPDAAQDEQLQQIAGTIGKKLFGNK